MCLPSADSTARGRFRRTEAFFGPPPCSTSQPKSSPSSSRFPHVALVECAAILRNCAFIEHDTLAQVHARRRLGKTCLRIFCRTSGLRASLSEMHFSSATATHSTPSRTPPADARKVWTHMPLSAMAQR
jgi:hypothetical protein